MSLNHMGKTLHFLGGSSKVFGELSCRLACLSELGEAGGRPSLADSPKLTECLLGTMCFGSECFPAPRTDRQL